MWNWLRHTRFLLIGLVVLLTLSSVRPVQAANEFATSLSTTYRVDQRGEVAVHNIVQIKNNFSSMYASQFALEVGSNTLSNVRVTDAQGTDLQPNIVQTDRKTSIALHFADKVVGKDQTREMVIDYSHPEVAVLTGGVLEVDIPKLANQDSFQAYTVSVEVPAQFGEPSAVTPIKFTRAINGSNNVYTFAENGRDGVNILFGTQQTFRFSLRYNLKNPSVSQGVVQVALPPDTPYQRLQFDSIEPQPEKIESDSDGNWIATFTLSGQKEQIVTAQGTVWTYLHPTVPVPVSEPDARYLAPTQYWPTDDVQMVQLANKLHTPRAIYQYVVQSLKYDYTRLNQGQTQRRGALAALAAPNTSLCQDFTDVFVTLARAAGIPARELTGYAYTDNPRLRPLSLANDVLHSWPEYYDRTTEQWIPVDPTWQNTTDGVDYFTKLDFHHVVFAIRGLNDSSPYPAGLYKLSGQAGKDVDVETAPDVAPQQMQLTLKPPQFPLTPNLRVRNQVGSAWYNMLVSLKTSPGVELTQPPGEERLTLLPYQTRELQLTASRKDWVPQATQVPVRVTIGDASVQYEVLTSSSTPFPILLAGLGVFCVLACGAGGVLVFRRRRHRTVRRQSQEP